MKSSFDSKLAQNEERNKEAVDQYNNELNTLKEKLDSKSQMELEMELWKQELKSLQNKNTILEDTIKKSEEANKLFKQDNENLMKTISKMS